MKSRFFPRRDEVVLSVMTACVVVGLLQVGISSYFNTKEHVMFKKNPVTMSKK